MNKLLNNDKLNTNSKPLDEENNSRRKFLHKAVYAAPTLVALGSLLQPTNAEAVDFGSTPNPPQDGGWN